MMQIIETTHQEKVEMYRLIDKDKLIEMLIECNRLLEAQMQVKNLSSNLPVMRSVCEPEHHNLDVLHLGCCSKCGKTQFKQTDC